MFRPGQRGVLVALLVLGVGAGVGLGLARSDRPAALLDRGRQALEEGDDDRSASYADRLEQKGCRDEADFLRGLALVKEGEAAKRRAEGERSLAPRTRRELLAHGRECFRKALRHLGRVRGEGAVAVDAAVRAAECLYHLEQRPLAAEGLAAVVKRHPGCKEAYQWLAAIYIDLNSALNAAAYLKEWARLDPEDGRPWRWIGFFYKDYNRPADAVEAYREACRRRLEPHVRAEVLREMAEALVVGQADYRAALEALDRCPEAYRRSPEVLTLRAEALWGKGDWAGATRLADEVLRAHPDAPGALLLRGRIDLAGDRPREAIARLEKAARLDPQDLRVRQHLMEAYKQAGDRGRAERERRRLEEGKGLKDRLTRLHRQASSRPGDDRVRYDIARLCLRLGRPAEARTWLRAALSCNPDTARARQELARLEGPGAAAARAPAGR